MSTKISITNTTNDTVVVEIEGMIGVPEDWQFEEPGARTATYDKFRTQVEQIRIIKSPKVVVNIRSTGGDVNDAVLIHDCLRSLGGEITTKCYGYVASAATIIAQAASKGGREMSSNALYLIHKSACTAQGNSKELARTLELLDTTDRTIASLYANRSGRPTEGFIALMNENNGNGRWLSPKEALDAGLVDKIVESSPISNDAAELVSNLGLPPLPTTKNEKTMNITKRWKSILELLGLQTEDENTLTETELDKIDNSLLMSEQELIQLRNKVTTLETQNAKLQAKATVTKPKEDPSASEFRRSGNDDAYTQDVKKFR